jgi:hypothetical protein
MRIRLIAMVMVVVVLVLAAPFKSALAARGTPGSAEFGYGAHLNLTGPFAIDGIRLASNLQLDWLASDLSWQSIAPKAGSVDWSRLDPIMQTAEHSQLAMFLSLVEPPDWALGPQGPDVAQTTQLVLALAQRYPKSLQAVELFPGANTRQGWGRQPDASAYLKVWNSVVASLQKVKSPIILVAAGLKPVPANSAPDEAIDDLVFLQNLYNLGIRSSLNIISVQAAGLTGEPLQSPTKEQNHVLRHYEEVRQVMLKNKHESGLIWLTRLAPPSGQEAGSDPQVQDPENQSVWLAQAFNQVKSQLYIGVAFLKGVNPSGATQGISLLQPGGDYHPFYRTLRDLVSINRSDSPYHRPGRPKDQPLQKSVK